MVDIRTRDPRASRCFFFGLKHCEDNLFDVTVVVNCDLFLYRFWGIIDGSIPCAPGCDAMNQKGYDQIFKWTRTTWGSPQVMTNIANWNMAIFSEFSH